MTLQASYGPLPSSQHHSIGLLGALPALHDHPHAPKSAQNVAHVDRRVVHLFPPRRKHEVACESRHKVSDWSSCGPGRGEVESEWMVLTQSQASPARSAGLGVIWESTEAVRRYRKAPGWTCPLGKILPL